MVAVPSIEDRKKHYVAGFLDGEGCFQYGNSPKISASNTHLPSLNRLQEVYGGTVRLRNGPVNENSRTCYEWYVYGDDAVKLCKELLPHLREKQLQAALVLALRYEPRPDCRVVLKEMLGKLKRL